MFNPFKVNIHCDHSIPSEEREKFLEFVVGQLQLLSCDRVGREGAAVRFSNNFISFSRGRHHLMAGVDSGTNEFSPFSSQLDYTYRSTRVGIVMLAFAGLALLAFIMSNEMPGFFPFFFIPFLALIIVVNWAVIRHRQKRFLQQLEPEYQRMRKDFFHALVLEPEYQRMKKVFSPSK